MTQQSLLAVDVNAFLCRLSSELATFEVVPCIVKVIKSVKVFDACRVVFSDVRDVLFAVTNAFSKLEVGALCADACSVEGIVEHAVASYEAYVLVFSSEEDWAV